MDCSGLDYIGLDYGYGNNNKKINKDVKNLSNHRQESHGWLQCVTFEASYEAYL